MFYGFNSINVSHKSGPEIIKSLQMLHEQILIKDDLKLINVKIKTIKNFTHIILFSLKFVIEY